MPHAYQVVSRDEAGALTDDLLDQAIAAIYDAVGDDAAWAGVEHAICRLLGANQVSFLVQDNAGPGMKTLMGRTDSSFIRSYNQHFRFIDPYRAHAESEFGAVQAAQATTTKLGQEIIAPGSFARSEFYADYARKMDRFHMLGGMLGRAKATPISVYRAHGAQEFGAQDQLLLGKLLPHLQRALDLRSRLERATREARTGLAALDALSAAVIVLDATMRVTMLNAAGERAVLAGQGLGFVRRRSSQVDDGERLAASRPADDLALRRLVEAVAFLGGAGGHLRLLGPDAGEPSLVLMVSPLPARLAGEGGGVMPGLAMVVVRNLARPPAQDPSLLATMFGLSRAEAGVASMVLAGQTLEQVSQSRSVGLETVRSQVKAVLRKSGATNLRDFERVATVLLGR